MESIFGNNSLQVEERTFFKKVDLHLILIMFALNIIGLINLYSATHGPNSRDIEPLFTSQIVWMTVGWLFFFIVTIFDYMISYRLAWFIYILNFAALVFTSFYGRSVLGGQRWIDLGFFRYQPSETMKVALILLLSRIISRRIVHDKGLGPKQLFLPAIVLLLPFVFIAKQPDLGTAMMIAAIGSTILFFARIRKWILISVVVLGIGGAWVGWHSFMRDFQKNRILTFISPTLDPHGSGYNKIQSEIAVGSGKFFGKGFRKGTQSQLEFLPERHTDFIYSVLSEEHGFLGSVTTMGLFCLLFMVIIRIAGQARDKYGALLTVGVLGYLFWHMFINIGMTIGVLPIVGVPLPLLSYGGSSLLTTMAGLGLVSSVAYRKYLF